MYLEAEVLSMLSPEYDDVECEIAAPGENPKMPRQAVFGCMRGQFKMADDFDAPLEDFKGYME